MDSIGRNENEKKVNLASDTRDPRKILQGQRSPLHTLLIDRDYRQPYAIRFSTTFPAILRGRVSEDTFEYTISQINCMFEGAEKYSCKTCTQALLGYFTVGFIYNFWDSKYERCIKQVSTFVEEQNTRVYAPLGISIKDPALKALRNLEIKIIN